MEILISFLGLVVASTACWYVYQQYNDQIEIQDSKDKYKYNKEYLDILTGFNTLVPFIKAAEKTLKRGPFVFDLDVTQSTRQYVTSVRPFLKRVNESKLEVVEDLDKNLLKEILGFCHEFAKLDYKLNEQENTEAESREKEDYVYIHMFGNNDIEDVKKEFVRIQQLIDPIIYKI